MRFLVVCPYLPHRGVGHGGGISTYHLIRNLARVAEVTVLALQRSDEEEATRDLAADGVRVETVFFASAADRGLARVRLAMDRLGVWLRSAGRDVPYMVVKYERRAVRRRLGELLEEVRPEAVLVEYMFMAPYARQARVWFDNQAGLWEKGTGPEADRSRKVILNTHEVGTLPRLRRLLRAPTALSRAFAGLQLAQWARYELAAVAWADIALCVTEQDNRLLESLGASASLVTHPLGVDLEALPRASLALRSPPRLLFVGSFDHPPNRDAALDLAERILPRIQQQHATCLLDLIGRNPPQRLSELAAASEGRIRLHGFVPDLDPFFDEAWLFAAPLWSGGGIKIKILEAMGRGLPVLTTPIGLEGIEVETGSDVAVARDVSGFVEEAARLLASPEVLRQLGRRARDRMAESYDWSRLARSLVELVAGHGHG